MEFQDVVRRRRMVRTYLPDPVDPAALDRVVRNATRAPSAGFTQGWAFLVLTEPEDVALFWSATTPDSADPSSAWLTSMRTAPVVVVPMSDESAYADRYAEPDKGWTDRGRTRWAIPYWHVDAGMASLLILQTAVDEGLGGCFFGIPPTRTAAFRSAFGVPDAYTPVGAITLGHPAPSEVLPGSRARRPRRDVVDVVHRGRW